MALVEHTVSRGTQYVAISVLLIILYHLSAQVNEFKSLIVQAFVRRPQRPKGFMRLPVELVLIIAPILSNARRFGDLAAFTRLLSLKYRYTRSLQKVLLSEIYLDTYECYASLTRGPQSTDSPQHIHQLG